MHIPRTITVLCDNREKYPLIYPKTINFLDPETLRSRRLKVKTEILTLECGDYCIKEFGAKVGVERKGSAIEIHQNFFTEDSVRAGKAFKKFKEWYDHCIVFLECTPYEFVEPSQVVKNPEKVFDVFQRFCIKNDFDFIVFPKVKTAMQRQAVGTMVLHYMLNKVCLEIKDE